MTSALILMFEALRFKSYPRPDFGELGSKAGLRISKFTLLYVSSLKFTYGPGACRLSLERVLDALFYGPQPQHSTSMHVLRLPNLRDIMAELVS